METVRALFFLFKVDMILKIPLSFNLPEDKLIWVANKKGEFTVKSAISSQTNSLTQGMKGNVPLVIQMLGFGRKFGL